TNSFTHGPECAGKQSEHNHGAPITHPGRHLTLFRVEDHCTPDALRRTASRSFRRGFHPAYDPVTWTLPHNLSYLNYTTDNILLYSSPRRVPMFVLLYAGYRNSYVSLIPQDPTLMHFLC